MEKYIFHETKNSSGALACQTASPGQPFSAAWDRLREFSPSLSPLRSDGRWGPVGIGLRSDSVVALPSVAKLRIDDHRHSSWDNSSGCGWVIRMQIGCRKKIYHRKKKVSIFRVLGKFWQSFFFHINYVAKKNDHFFFLILSRSGTGPLKDLYRMWTLRISFFPHPKIFRWTVLEGQEELWDPQHHFLALRSRYESIAHI